MKSNKLKLFFVKITSIGTNPTDTDANIKTIRIVNGVSIIGGGGLFLAGIFVLLLLPVKIPEYSFYELLTSNDEQKLIISNQWIILYPMVDFLMGGIAALAVLCNYYKKYNFAVFLVSFMSVFFSFSYVILIGLRISYFFLVSSVIPIIFYKKTWKYVSFWIFNIIAFIITVIFVKNFGEIFATPPEMLFTSIIINLLPSFFIIFFTINYFKKENIRNENKLEEKNLVLQTQKEEITAQRDEITTQRDEILMQKSEIEKKNQSITQSITYAGRIQNAVLPSLNNIISIFNDFFVFFQPRDIISGDFYFIKKINNYVIISVADCTGHGVPGAFMSVLGISLLKEISIKKEITTSSQVLNELREQIKSSLQQTGQHGEQQDGMDIAFCSINSETLEMSFSGAHNPCWIFRTIENEQLKIDNEKNKLSIINYQLSILEADHQPIGIYLKEKPFTEHKFQLQKDDIIYLFSDGYESQFGGEKNEKFKTKRFKDLLSEINILPLAEQEQILEQKFNEWKGNYEQTDDVLVVGVKF